MTAILDRTVGELVAEKPSRSRIFERLGIDYCCGGKRPLADAARERGYEPSDVVEALIQSDRLPTATAEREWRYAPLSDLLDDIVTRHHHMMRQELPRLATLFERVVRAHGANRPALIEAQAVFRRFAAELQSHMQAEEGEVFPLIRDLEVRRRLDEPRGQQLLELLSDMESEHAAAGAALESMRRLHNDYLPPEGACNTYRALLDGLAEVEYDMHEHVHKENHIAFPRALQLLHASTEQVHVPEGRTSTAPH